jgi:hypothetical protein
MRVHLCGDERALVWVGRGEACNWCQAAEICCNEVDETD